MIRTFALSGATLGLALASGACSSTSTPPQAEVVDSTRTSLSLLPATLRAHVVAHIEAVAARDAGASWAGATLEEDVDVLLQPGVAGPAYYQVHVRASGERRGYVIFRSAAEAGQSPIVSWSSYDNSPVDAVRAEANARERRPSQSLFMLDPFTAVLEDNDGELAPPRASPSSTGRTYSRLGCTRR